MMDWSDWIFYVENPIGDAGRKRLSHRAVGITHSKSSLTRPNGVGIPDRFSFLWMADVIQRQCVSERLA